MNQPVMNEPTTESFLDKRFATWVVANFSCPDKTILEKLAKAVSYAVHLKHTCLDLASVAQMGDPILSKLDLKPSEVMQQLLPVTGAHPLTCSNDGKKIWLQKYHYFESQCALKLSAMATHTEPLDAKTIQELDDLFGKDNSEQKEAAKKALEHRLAIITGGPGTGKTYTVARIIELLLKKNANTRIELAAPTGKAAQRAKAALDQAMIETKMSETQKAKLPEKAKTLHGLLGFSMDSIKPKRNEQNTLALDVLIIDEASMIDLPMMYRILSALPMDAKLILLGDKDQLASVEAGSVLGELCLTKKLENCRVNITKSRRFDEKSEIGILATWINEGATSALSSAQNKKVALHSVSQDSWHPDWLKMACDHYNKLQGKIINGTSPQDLLTFQKTFQILCALREGPFGVTGINSIIERALHKKTQSWYAGMPVMILQNDNERKLYNGDVGMVLPVNAEGTHIDTHSKQLKACFMTDNKVRTFSKAQMPPFETCYAMTVHKSQGSEYNHVLIVLPADASTATSNPVLTKELAYTAVTRAREKIDLYTGKGVLEAMATHKTVRMSGLAELLDV